MIRRVQQNARAAARHKVELPDTYTALKAHVDPGVDLDTGIKGMMPRTFIHFSDIEKLGIYPKSEYNTPVGIYAYPLTDIILRKFQIGALPFAQDRALVILFDVKDTRGIAYSSQDIPARKYEWLQRRMQEDDRIYNGTWKQPSIVVTGKLANLNDRGLNQYIDVITDQYGRIGHSGTRIHWTLKDFRRWFAAGVYAHYGAGRGAAIDFAPLAASSRPDVIIRHLEDEIVDLLDTRGLLYDLDPRDLPGHIVPLLRLQWWQDHHLSNGPALHLRAREVLEEIFDEMDIQTALSFAEWEQDAYVNEINLGKLWNITRNLVGGNPRKWAQLLREFEIDGVVDDVGYGVIHEHEPIQAVFFGAAILRVIEIFPNEYTPSKIKRRRSATWSRAKDVGLSPHITEDED